MRTRNPEADSPRSKRRPGRPHGKRSDPDYIQVSAYIQHNTYEAARHKLAEEASDKDFSLLVDRLLVEWIGRSRDRSTQPDQFLEQLQSQITDVLKEAEALRKRPWNPDNVSKFTLVQGLKNVLIKVNARLNEI